MTKITIETETITTDLTPSEAAAKIKEALGIAEWPQVDDWYWCVNANGDDFGCRWYDDKTDHYRLAHGNCSPTQEGLAQYKGVMAKVAALWAIEQHRDKTFGVFEPDWKDSEQEKWSGYYEHGDSALRLYVTIQAKMPALPFISPRSPTSNAHSQSAVSIGRC